MEAPEATNGVRPCASSLKDAPPLAEASYNVDATPSFLFRFYGNAVERISISLVNANVEDSLVYFETNHI